jgi:hypothetical protein
MTTYRDTLAALAAELDALACADTVEAERGLRELLDNARPEAISRRLRRARSEALAELVDARPTHFEVARLVGLTEAQLSKLLRVVR